MESSLGKITEWTLKDHMIKTSEDYFGLWVWQEVCVQIKKIKYLVLHGFFAPLRLRGLNFHLGASLMWLFPNHGIGRNAILLGTVYSL